MGQSLFFVYLLVVYCFLASQMHLGILLKALNIVNFPTPMLPEWYVYSLQYDSESILLFSQTLGFWVAWKCFEVMNMA